MSNKGPNIYGRSPKLLMNGNTSLNAAASSYVPGSRTQNNTISQVSLHLAPQLDSRVSKLEEGHSGLREKVDSLTELYNDLCSSVDKIKQGGWPVTVGSFQEQDPDQSRQSALAFRQGLDQLSCEVHQSVDGITDAEKFNAMATPKTSGSVPPHLRVAGGASTDAGSKSNPPHLRSANGASIGAESKSIPPHLRGKSTHVIEDLQAAPTSNSRLATDGPVDNVVNATVPAPELSPPVSRAATPQQDLPIDKLSVSAWQPHFLKTLSPLLSEKKIPSATQMVSFHPQFLEDHLKGSDWSPGLRFVMKPDSTCIIKNRTYYLLNPATEPYLPEQPGQHGAKLSAFFNKSPEDTIPDLPLDLNSYENVPMFVEQGGRYIYFGNYSQTRWSDKLDVDTTTAKVPQHVKEFWATELTSPIRPEWMTEELKNHFFKKPEYNGRMFPASGDDATATTEQEVEWNDKMAKDVRLYIEELRNWEREAKMKTAMIKKQFILDAFEAADADEPPALRLWWEYLECVDWRKDFYDLLVTLQSREARYLK